MASCNVYKYLRPLSRTVHNHHQPRLPRSARDSTLTLAVLRWNQFFLRHFMLDQGSIALFWATIVGFILLYRPLNASYRLGLPMQCGKFPFRKCLLPPAATYVYHNSEVPLGPSFLIKAANKELEHMRTHITLSRVVLNVSWSSQKAIRPRRRARCPTSSTAHRSSRGHWSSYRMQFAGEYTHHSHASCLIHSTRLWHTQHVTATSVRPSMWDLGNLLREAPPLKNYTTGSFSLCRINPTSNASAREVTQPPIPSLLASLSGIVQAPAVKNRTRIHSLPMAGVFRILKAFNDIVHSLDTLLERMLRRHAL